MIVIAIATQKGGAGKTTTAQALAQGLNRTGRKTLLIDLDSQQAGLTSIMGASVSGNTAYEVLKGECRIIDAIQSTPQGDIIARSPKMGQIDTEIRAGREVRLKIALETLRGYDYVVIDTPPASGILTDNALSVADGVIIPAQPDVMSLYALEQSIKEVNDIQRYTNPDLRILGILITRYNSRTALSNQFVDILQVRAENMGTKVYDTKIRECIAIKEDQASQTNLYERSGKYNSVKDYTAFTNEVIEQIEG